MEIRIYVNFCIFFLQSYFLLLADSLENSHVSDLRLCADPACSVPISHGYGKLRYATNNKYGVSFKKGTPVTVYSKDAGTKVDVWGVMVEGKRGYAPKDFISERHVLIERKNLAHIVPTEPYMKEELEIVTDIQDQLLVKEDISVKKDIEEVLNVINNHNILSSFVLPGSFAENIDSPVDKNEIHPSKVKTVIDGTTLYENDVPLAEGETYNEGSSNPSQLDINVEAGHAEAKRVDSVVNSQTGINSGKSENYVAENDFTINKSPGLDDFNNSDVSDSGANSVLESKHEKKEDLVVPEKETEAGGAKPVEEKESSDKSKSDNISKDVDSSGGNEVDDADDYDVSDNIDDDDEEEDDDDENEEDEEGDGREEIGERPAEGQIPGTGVPDSLDDITSENNTLPLDSAADVNESNTEQVKLESLGEEKSVISDQLTEPVQEKQIDEILSQGEVLKEKDYLQAVPGEEVKLYEKSVEEKLTDAGNVSGSVINSDKSITENETVRLDSPDANTANFMEQIMPESLPAEKSDEFVEVTESVLESKEVLKEKSYWQAMSPPVQVPDKTLGSTNDNRSFDDVSAQSSDNPDKSSKVEYSGTVMNNFIQPPEVNSESFSFQSLKEESKVVKNVDETTSDKIATDTISSDTPEFDKVAEIDSGFDHKFGIDDNKTALPDVQDIGKESEGFDHAGIEFEKASNDFKVHDVKTSTEANDLKVLIQDESAITPPGEVTEKLTMHTSSDVIDSLVKKDSDENVEATTQSIYDTLSLPSFSNIQPPAEEQIGIDVQLSDLKEAQSEEGTKDELFPEKEPVLFKEEDISFEEKSTADDFDGESWFNFNFITDLFSSFSKPSEETVDEPLIASMDSAHSPLIEKPEFASEQEYCSADQQGENSCRQFEEVKDDNLSAESDKGDSWDTVMELIFASQNVAVSTNSLIYLIITTVAVILFSLGYYYIENHRNDSVLIAKINKLERDLLVFKKEAAMLQDKLQSTESQITLSHDNLTEFNEQIAALTQELEETKAAKLELEEQYVILEKEFDAATESGMEMHRLLTESLSNQDGSQVLLKTVENLREKIDHQGGEIKELKQLLSEKTEEIEQLNEEMKNNQETRKALQEKLTSLRREKEEEVLGLKDSNRTLSTQLGDLMEEKSLIEMKLSNDISKLRLLVEETQTKLADREGEIDALKEAIAKLNKHENEENLDALYDTARVSSKLSTVEKERDSYKEKFLEEEGARKLLEDHVQMTRQEVKSLKENYEAAEKEKIEALTKLQVLSNYFKEKESQLQKELGLQESMWLQKQSDDHTIYEQMKTLREENEKFKLQNESLKKEICESESAFKIQIANAEQKAHDHWLTTRQLERRLKETQSEATQLRNRLTLVEKNATNLSSDDLKQNMSYSIGETNGDPSSPPPTMPLFPPATSPPFMMFGGAMPPPPPPTSEFLPPPPPPLGFPEGRPPPVGRISSPPLDHSFSPPPIPYFYDSAVYGGHHSPSPPPHRPMPKPLREMGMDQKDRASPPKHEQERTGRRSKR